MSAQPSLQGTFILIGSIAALAFFACHNDADSANSQTRPAASSAKATSPASTTPAATGNQSHLTTTYNDQRNELELANGGSAGASHSGHHKGKGGAAGGGMGGSKGQ